MRSGFDSPLTHHSFLNPPMKLKHLNRNSISRQRLFKKQLVSLIKFDRIQTTLAKAQALKPIADKYVTMAKKNTPGTRLKACELGDKDSIVKLFSEVRERYMNKKGGYTRIWKAGYTDGSPNAILEFVDCHWDLKNTLNKWFEDAEPEKAKAYFATHKKIY